MLIDLQHLFVRLAAEQDFRQAFFADPEQALAPYALDEHEAATLRGIPQDTLRRYADSLLAKRSREFSRSVPLTLRVSPSLTQRYRRWLAGHPSPCAESALPPGLREALRALGPLRRALIDDPGEAVYAADVLALEALGAASRIDGRIRSFRSRFRADVLFGELRRGRLPVDPIPAPSEYQLSRKRMLWRPLTS